MHISPFSLDNRGLRIVRHLVLHLVHRADRHRLLRLHEQRLVTALILLDWRSERSGNDSRSSLSQCFRRRTSRLQLSGCSSTRFRGLGHLLPSPTQRRSTDTRRCRQPSPSTVSQQDATGERQRCSGRCNSRAITLRRRRFDFDDLDLFFLVLRDWDGCNFFDGCRNGGKGAERR